MPHKKFWLRLMVCLFSLCLPIVTLSLPAYAAVDPYVTRFLRVSEPIPLKMDTSESTRLFSAEDLSIGKALFGQNCLNCHVGGNTLPDPTVPLSLAALQGATPKRDNINALVTYLRQPMTYDGTEETLVCRQISEAWLPTPMVENIAGFILRAAETAPGWGTETFQN